MFKFKSITYRLLFWCFLVFIAIYILAFSQASKLIKNTTQTWVRNIVKVKVDGIAVEIEKNLDLIEKNVQLIAKNLENDQISIQTNKEILSAFNSLITQPKIIGISFNQNELTNDYSNLINNEEIQSNRSSKNLINLCQETKLFNQKAFWSEVYSLEEKYNSLAITYCYLISSPSQQNKHNESFLAVEISLDWILPLVKSKLNLVDKTSYGLNIGDFWIISPKKRKWIIKPPSSIEKFGWFSQENNETIFNQNLISSVLFFVRAPSDRSCGGGYCQG